MRAILLLFLFLPITLQIYIAMESGSLRKIPTEKLSNQSIGDKEINLPIYELMNPQPQTSGIWIPKIEYKKGPPERFIERVSLVYLKNGGQEKEREVFYGRHTNENFWLKLGSSLTGSEESFLSNSLEYALTGKAPQLSFTSSALAKLAMLETAKPYLFQVSRALLLDQASNYAYLFFYENSESSQKQASAYFFRRNSQFRIDYLADREFQILKPQELFAKSFIISKRQDALEFLAAKLSQVHVDAAQPIQNTLWPLALLTANLSQDPSSIDTYFHFAGLNAMLLKSKEFPIADTESLDILRNNILSANQYMQDIQPNSPKSAEIAKLSRTILRNIQ